MIALGLSTSTDLDTTSLQVNQLEETLLHLMRIFIAEPQKGFINKVRKYLGIESKETVTVREFASAFKSSFPSVSKHLRNYITHKLRDSVKEFRILGHFDSKILREDAVFLCLRLPELTGKEISLLYTSDEHGVSFHSYEKRLVGYDGPFLLLVEHSSGGATYKFGTFQTGPVRDLVEHQGDLRGFMFSIEPNIRFMTTDKGDGGVQYFFINTIDEKISKRRKGLGFGGDKHKDNCKLWIDQDLDKSTVYNGPDPTYGYGPLADPMNTDLSIRHMEIWGLGNHHDLQKQKEYWEDRADE